MSRSSCRVAIIGLGRIASTIDDEVRPGSGTLLPYSHMACYREVPQVEVVAGADLYAEQREAFRQRWDEDRLYTATGRCSSASGRISSACAPRISHV